MPIALRQTKFRQQHIHPMFTRPKNACIPHNNAGDFLDLLMAQDIQRTDTEGLVTIVARTSNNQWITVTSVPASKISEFYARGFYTKPKYDYYFGKALSKEPHSYKSNDAFAFTFISIDIDAHECAKYYTNEQMEYLCSTLSSRLCHDMPDDETYPQPNAVIFSGRGIHIIWLIQQEPANRRKEVAATANYLADIIQAELENDDTFKGFEIDRAALNNLSGLMRMPGTVNSKNGAQGTFRIFHTNRYRLSNLSASASSIRITVPVMPLYNEDTSQTIPTGLARIKALEQLNTIRGGIKEGLRDKYLLIYYCACRMARLSDQESIRRTLAMNKMMPVPCEERNVVAALKTAREKFYCFRDSTIEMWLNITPEERTTINWHAFHTTSKGKHFARDTRRATEKAERISRVLNAFDECGEIAESARRAKVAYNTAKKYITLYLNSTAETTVDAAVDLPCSNIKSNNAAHQNSSSSKIIPFPSSPSHSFSILSYAAKKVPLSSLPSSVPTPHTSFFDTQSFKNGCNIFGAYQKKETKRAGRETPCDSAPSITPDWGDVPFSDCFVPLEVSSSCFANCEDLDRYEVIKENIRLLHGNDVSVVYSPTPATLDMVQEEEAYYQGYLSSQGFFASDAYSDPGYWEAVFASEPPQEHIVQPLGSHLSYNYGLHFQE